MHVRVSILSLCVATLCLATPASGQNETPPDVQVNFAHDSGWVQNSAAPGTGPEVVISFPVIFDGASSLRLFFDEIVLAGNLIAGTSSLLRITSLSDGAVQTLNSGHVMEWQNSTAYFNGSAVQVDVLAWPGTGDNRVVLDHLDVGVPLVAYESQCGPTDDREPSNDPRVSRLLPVGCTSWTIDDCGNCMLSAGHCVGFINLVEFNVPFSAPNGSLNHPGPEDQYPVDPASIQSNGGGGVGNDYAYFGTFPNPNTGLTAFQAQGSAFGLTAAPAPSSGATIRITGHGTDSSPNSTYNQVQQTHAGPLVTNSGTTLQYQADTTGGSSGSPVIWDNEDVAVGIHTHAGCSTSGTGANQGTSIVHSGLQNFLANPSGVCRIGAASGGIFTDLGNGLVSGPFTEAPVLTACGTLSGHSLLRINVSAENVSGAILSSTLVIGASQINAPFKGGVMVPNPDVLLPGLAFAVPEAPLDVTSQLTTVWPDGVPSGTSVYLQHWIQLSGSASGLLASNGLEITTP
jgi:hypothetical protein